MRVIDIVEPEGGAKPAHLEGGVAARQEEAEAELAELDEAGDDSDDELERDWLRRLADLVPCLGILLALCSSVLLASASMLVKMTTSVHGVQVAVFRGGIQLVIYLATILLRRLPLRWSKNEFLPVTLRASFSALSITLTHFALKMIPLGDLTVIKFSLPIWTLVVSYFVLNESCSLLKILAACVSMLGVLLIAKPALCIYLFHLTMNGLQLESDEALQVHALDYWAPPSLASVTSVPQNSTSLEVAIEDDDLAAAAAAAATAAGEAADSTHLIGCLFALTSSVLLAMSIVSLKLCRKTPTETILFWLSLYSVVFGSGMLLYIGQWRMPDNYHDWLCILLNGLCGSAGQFCFTSALKVEQSGVISLARTADIQVAFLYSAFLLHEEVKATSILGCLLVSSAVVAIIVPKLFADKLGKSKEVEKA